MKVNIIGKGVIPYVNRVAPVYNTEVNAEILKKLVKNPKYKIYGSDGSGQVTAATFNPPIPTASPVVEEKPVEAPKPKKTSKKAKQEEYHPNVTVTEVPDEIGIDLAQTLDSVIETDVKVEEEVEKVEEPVAETEELEIPIEETDVEAFPAEEAADEEEESVEESTDEAAPKQTSKKKKKNRR